MDLQNLLTRAQAILDSPARDYTEIGQVHRAVTGVDYDCRPCNERRIINTLTTFVNHPERYALRIKEAHTEMEQNQNTAYRFSKNATSKLIVIVTAHGIIKVTPETLTNEKAEAVLRHRQYAHNIERIPGTEPSEEELAAAKKAEEEALAKQAEEEAKKAEEERLAKLAAEEAKQAEEKSGKAGASGLAPNGNVITQSVELSLDQVREKYERLTGQAPGSRNMKTMLAAIQKIEESK